MSRAVAVVAVLVLAATAPARADTPPWSVGVTEAHKAAAQQFVDAGNALFLTGKYAEALEQYRAAVGAWDHPAIRFNIVRCLIQLDRTVDAADNLKLALAYGAAPLADAVYTEALAYDKLLANQIGDLAVGCTQAGVVLTLDGAPLATCPAEATRRLAPGPHQIVGTKPGFLTRTVEFVVLGGKAQRVEVALDPLAKGARIVHRWSPVVPWVVFGGGFAVASIGGFLDLSAASDMASYDRFVVQNCTTRACADRDLEPVADLKPRAELKTAIAAGVLIAGAATIATGAVMLYLNRGRTVYVGAGDRLTPAVTPVPGGATLSVAGSF